MNDKLVLLDEAKSFWKYLSTKERVYDNRNDQDCVEALGNFKHKLTRHGRNNAIWIKGQMNYLIFTKILLQIK